MLDALPDSGMLLELANTPMPYGRYQGRRLVDLPEPYVIWLVNNALPKGKLGQQFLLLREIKVNGLEGLLQPLKTRR